MPSTIGQMPSFSNASFLQETKGNLAEAQGKVAGLTEQLSTGKLYHTYDKVKEPEILLTLKKEVNDLNYFEENIKKIKIQLQATQASLNEVNNLFENLLQKTAELNNTTIKDISLKIDAEGLMIQIGNLLNRKGPLGDLFTGTRVGDAVDLSALAAPAYPSVADTTYFKGNDGEISYQISPSDTVTLKALINKPATEYGLRAVNICAHLKVDDPNYYDKIREAQGLLQKSLGLVYDSELAGDAFPHTITRIDQFLERIDTAEVSNQTVKMNIESTLASEENTDIAKALVDNEILKSQYKMSMLITMQFLKELNLADIMLRQ